MMSHTTKLHGLPDDEVRVSKPLGGEIEKIRHELGGYAAFSPRQEHSSEASSEDNGFFHPELVFKDVLYIHSMTARPAAICSSLRIFEFSS